MPIYHLTLHAPLHVGESVGIEREATLEWFPSDSLFSAIATVWLQTGKHGLDRLIAFENSLKEDKPLPFLLTSAFPWVSGIRFYPAPVFSTQSGLEGKAAKKVRWISDGVLAQLTIGKMPRVDTNCLLHSGSIWLTPEERTAIPESLYDIYGELRLWASYVVPRVTVDRVTNASNLFHTGRISFAPGGGLWFAVCGDHADWVENSLAALEDTGLGGLRSYGHGAFSYHRIDEELSIIDAGSGYCLSRYAPASVIEIQNSIQQDDAAYKLVQVGGWCVDSTGHPWRRRVVRMVSEGALFPDVSGLHGKLVQVQPSQKAAPHFGDQVVYRSGLPYFISAGELTAGEIL